MAVKPTIYDIHLSDGTLKTTIGPYNVDTTATSLKLPGCGRLDYGHFMDENLVHMVENFANTNRPAAPLAGQLWYKKDAQVLYLHGGGNPITDWRRLVTSTTDGTLTLKGDIDMESTYRIINLPNATQGHHAISRSYADSRYVNVTGDTLTGFLTLNAAPTANMHAANKQYVDATAAAAAEAAAGAVAGSTQTGLNGKVNRSGDTMTGFLTLHAAPTANMHAATKQYVDTAVSPKVNRTGDTMTGSLIVPGFHVNRTTQPHGREGGEISLARPTAETQLGGDVTIDAYRNQIRFFEQVVGNPGLSRGAYIDLSTCTAPTTSKIWHDNNDGHGSGLDADTLDGMHLHDILASAASASVGTNGWVAIGPVIIQWGNDTSNNVRTVSFPRRFPNACTSVQITRKHHKVWAYGNEVYAFNYTPTVFQYEISGHNGSWQNGYAVSWMAIGY